MEDLIVRRDVTIGGHELWVTTSRSGGAGGQHVNKTSSRVSLHWSVQQSSALTDAQRRRVLARLRPHVSADGILQVHSDSTRSQHQNKQLARERLAELVRAALHVPKSRKKTRPSRGQRARRVETKKRRSRVKESRKKPGRDDDP
jgi:ribosome-associated protein